MSAAAKTTVLLGLLLAGVPGAAGQGAGNAGLDNRNAYNDGAVPRREVNAAAGGFNQNREGVQAAAPAYDNDRVSVRIRYD